MLQALFQMQAPRDEAAKLEEQRKLIEFHVIGNSLTGPVNKQTMLWLIGKIQHLNEQHIYIKNKLLYINSI